MSTAKRYLDDLVLAIAKVDSKALGRLVSAVVEALAGRQTVFLGGNGGSSTAAAHMASDWSAAASSVLGGPVSIVCLTDNIARLTALANDVSYEEVFSRQIAVSGRPGDLLVLLSVSAASPNLVSAAKTAKILGVRVVALVGHAGPLVAHCDDWLEFGQGDYGLVEDLHVAINHIVVRAIHHGEPQLYPPHTGAKSSEPLRYGRTSSGEGEIATLNGALRHYGKAT